MAQTTDFGKAVKKKLIDVDKNQNWLIKEINERTGLFIDSAYLSKIFTGKRASPKVTAAIREILDIPDEKEIA